MSSGAFQRSVKCEDESDRTRSDATANQDGASAQGPHLEHIHAAAHAPIDQHHQVAAHGLGDMRQDLST